MLVRLSWNLPHLPCLKELDSAEQRQLQMYPFTTEAELHFSVIRTEIFSMLCTVIWQILPEKIHQHISFDILALVNFNVLKEIFIINIKLIKISSMINFSFHIHISIYVRTCLILKWQRQSCIFIHVCMQIYMNVYYECMLQECH